MRCFLGWLILAFAILTVAPSPTRAADWPSKPIRIVVPFAPGGAADVWARVVAEHLAAGLKQSVVVENKGGAGGIVGSQQVARSDPDGYTLLLGGLASQVIAPAMGGNAGYDSLRDFTYVAYIGGPPIAWVVQPSSDIRTVKDVFDRARAGTLSSYASSGVGTLGHLVVEDIAKKQGVALNHVPYNTAAFADIIAGRIPLGTFTWNAVLGQAQGGTLRPIVITTAARLPDFPDLPTFKELGYDLVASTWFALAAPKGLPPEIAQRINREVTRIMDLPELKKRVVQDAFDPKPMTPDQVLAFMQSETARWTPVAQNASIKPK